MDLKELFFTPDGRAQLRDLLFGYDGRIPRSKFWLATLVSAIIYFVLMVMTFPISWLPYAAIFVAFILTILVLISGTAVTCKRLHDRGKSGWFQLVYWGGQGALSAIGRCAGSTAIVFELASLTLFVWMMIELGFRRGTEGPNKYGPDPLAVSPEVGGARQS